MNILHPFNILPEGINLVEASAGTGKTYTITSIYIRLLLVEELGVDEILVVTYTENATKELRDRVINRIREAIRTLKAGKAEDEDDRFLSMLLEAVPHRDQAVSTLEQAIRNFDEAAIYTIHGFCYQVLQEQAFESRVIYDAEMVGDDSDALQEIIDDYWRNFVTACEQEPVKKPLLQYLLEEGYDPGTLEEQLSDFVGKPYLSLLPTEEPFTDSELKSYLEELQALFREIKKQWHPESITELLKSDVLDGRSFKSSYIEKWVREMEELLAENQPPLKVFDNITRFTPAGLKEGMKQASIERGESPPQHPFFEVCESYQRLAERLQSYETLFRRRLLLWLQDHIDEKKEQLQILSYDDLLLKLNRALTNSGGDNPLSESLRRSYPVALVDEFQDTDPVQYEIFRRIYKDERPGSGLFMIGDPKQSIYSFRGADIYTYLDAREDAPTKNIYTLNRNFRAVPELIEAINHLYGEIEDPFLNLSINYRPVDWGGRQEDRLQDGRYGDNALVIRDLTPMTGSEAPGTGDAMSMATQDTVAEIVRLLNGHNGASFRIGSSDLEPKDIAVLVRTHYQANLISDELREAGLNSVKYSQESVYSSSDADELLRLMRAAADPGNGNAIRNALATSMLGESGSDLYRLKEDEERWNNETERFRSWQERWRDEGFSSMLRLLLRDKQVLPRLARLQHGERRITNLMHLAELLQEAEREHGESMHGLVKWLARKKNDQDGAGEEEQLRLESDEDLIKIVTIHRSKGLEYPVVFCPFQWYKKRAADDNTPVTFHDPESDDRFCLSLYAKGNPQREEHRVLAAREELQESLRLAYVAMTRASQRCYLSWIPAKHAEVSALGYMLQRPAYVLTNIDLRTRSGSSSDGVDLQQVREQLEQFGEGPVTVHPVDEIKIGNLDRAGTRAGGEELTARSFDRQHPLQVAGRISSFSSLTRIGPDETEMPDYDQYFSVRLRPGPEEESEREMNRFTFPRGPNPGTCLHKIFEDMEFRDLSKLPELVGTKLDLFNIDSRWNEIAVQMVQNTLSKQLSRHTGSRPFRLEGQPEERMIDELEFHFALGSIETRRLLSLIRPGSDTAGSNLHVEPGFMKGFVDLTLRVDDRFYIIDYKSNHLGNRPEDYADERLIEEVRESRYDLQYHIYTVALHRYLKHRMAGYTYEKNFGGVYYLFLRGIDGGEDNQRGVYFDRPDSSLVENLDRYLEEGESP